MLERKGVEGRKEIRHLGGGWNKRPASGGGKNDNGVNVEDNRGETKGE